MGMALGEITIGIGRCGGEASASSDFLVHNKGIPVLPEFSIGWRPTGTRLAKLTTFTVRITTE